MGRYCGAVCKLCRREGEKLFLKGERCFTDKCGFERRPVPPGQHGAARQAYSQYKVQLREKQKVKRIYGLLEKKFRLNYAQAARKKGVTGSQLLVNLERRLDNIVYRLGFGISRRQSRQEISHGKILVNGKRVRISSYLVSAGDVVEVTEKAKSHPAIIASMDSAASRSIPAWLSLDKSAAKGTIVALPTREQLSPTIREQLIVELYSK